MSDTIRLVCAWCNTVLREGAEPTSHGICHDCATKERDRYDRQTDTGR